MINNITLIQQPTFKIIKLNTKKYILNYLTFVFLLLHFIVYSQNKNSIETLELKLTQSKVDTATVNLYFKLADAYDGVNVKKFNQNLSKGIALANKIKFSKGIVKYHNMLAYKSLSEGNPKKGLFHAHKASALCIASNDTVGYLKNMYYEAAAYMYLGDYNQMKAHVNRALDFIKGKSFYTDRGVLYSLMVQYYSRNDLAKSFEYIVLEYDCLKKNNDPSQMFSVYNEFAGYYFNVADFKESIKFSKKALVEANKISTNNDYNKAFAMSNLGNVYLLDKQIQNAKKYITASLQISEKIKNPILISKNELLLSEIYLNEKKYKQVITISQKAISNNELPEYNVNGKLYIASAYNGLNKPSEALKILKSIDSTLTENLIIGYKLDYYRELSNSYQALGNFKLALEASQKYNIFQEKFLEDKSSLNTIGLQSKFQIREKNYLINKLNLEKQKIELKHEQQKTKFNLLIGGVILLTILVALLIWAYQFRKRGNFIFGLSRVQLQNAIQEKEILVKEIHHRVKNNFQLISSMMNIQAMDKSIDVTEFVKRTDSRILSLSNIHEKLYLKDNLYQLDANEYLKEMADNVKNSFLDENTKIEYVFSKNIVILDLEIIMPLGLIVNELLTNSYKYAFVDRTEGRIEIKISKISFSKYKLVYMDNGVGQNSEIKFSQSIGMNLISALCNQLHTEPKMSFENGAYFEIIFKTNHSYRR